jgi:thiol-disulfide isomerase/thioredoxin
MVMDKDSLLITFIPKETDMQLSQSYYDNGGPIVTDNWAFRVNGRGREKFHLHGYLDSLSREAGKQVRGRMASVTVLDGAEAYQDMVNLVASLGTNYEGVEKLLILNAWGGLLTQVILDIRGQFRNVALPVEKKAKYTDWYMAELAFREENYSKNILDIMSRSPEMIEYLYHHYLWLHTQVEGGRYEVLPIYDRIKEMIGHSDLREKVLTRFLMAYFGDDPSEAILRDSRSFFRNPLCIDWLNRFEAKLSGQDIKLTLPDMSGRKYSAEEFRGKVVLIDFWYMACIPCRNYMKTVISPLSKYFDREAGFQIITVSTDDKATFSKVLKTNDFLPSDALHLYTEDKRFRHPVLNRLGVNSYPYPILLNKEGKILATGSKLKDLETVKKIITKELER